MLRVRNLEQTNRMTKQVWLNVGCGFDKKPNTETIDWVNIDNSKEVSPDIKCDLDLENLPLEDNTVDGVLMIHSLEHFVCPVEVLERLYKVSKNGAQWFIEVPFASSHQDNLFHHTMGWHHGSFDKMLVGNPRPYYTKVRLKLLKVTGLSHGWLVFLPFRRKLSSLFNNIYYSIFYELEVVK